MSGLVSRNRRVKAHKRRRMYTGQADFAEGEGGGRRDREFIRGRENRKKTENIEVLHSCNRETGSH